MIRGVVVAAALLSLVAYAGLAGAQEQNDEGILGKVKSVLPGEKDTAGAQKAADETAQSAQEGAAATQKEGAGFMDKVKGVVSGGEKDSGGMMEKMKGVIPGGKSSPSGSSSGMMEKAKGIFSK